MATTSTGYVVAPMGLQSVLQAVRRITAGCKADIYRSHFNGAETLHFSTASADFETTPLDYRTRHLLNGGASGNLQEVVALSKPCPKCLPRAGIEHSFEVYNNDDFLVQLISGTPTEPPSEQA